ncbi:two-component regulator propeller domain-containing protein [Flavobacterium sp. KACC 22761]|uniref:hybrid sensor histidine kinase/response regulator transcription factor n=1 Tax=Flavobacterium sp. KACC 22761 TaxID=3092665 RepID=UPI002A74F4EE|nr:two-component regulator propeller domain-containing protein [Flavobacterium sp. KACC 22761]WPO78239.1 two-component regulator propeller domain-containing protein [Flavobacterium sp. KACC 22761]
MILKNQNFRILFWGICVWSLLFSYSKSFAQNNSISFNHLDVTNGLSNNSVLSISQDSTGFIWLGTKYGLNRFDGRTFKIFKNDPEDKNTISSNDFIKKLAFASNKKMWVVTSGLDLYHSKDNSFVTVLPQTEGLLKVLQDSKGNLWIGSLTQLKFKGANSNKILPIKIAKENLQVSELFEDNAHHIWVGTSDGLYEMFFANKKLVVKRHFSSQFKNSENVDLITSIVQDQNLRYWIGTRKSGLYLFDKKTMKLSHFVKNSNDKNSLVNNNVRKILLHKNGSLWIGTQDGLSILNPYTQQFINYQHDPAKPNSLSQNSIYDIFQDKNGSVWIGTYFGGVNVVYSVNTPFVVYQNNSNKNSISSNIISSIVEDSRHNLWIGTEAGGLNYFNRETQQFSNYKNNINDKNSLSSNLVKAIAIDKNQNIWIGTGLGGLDLFNSKTANFTVFKRNATNRNSIASDNINCLIVNSENKLFIGTDSGLNICDIESKKFSFFPTTGKTFIEKSISALFEDKKGTIWIGTPLGIYNYQGSKLLRRNFKDSSNKIFKYNINCFLEDSHGFMWVGTYHNGLALLDLKNNSYKIFNTDNGLPSDNILAITEDNDSNLWIGTDNGLVKYNRRFNTFRTFNILDGLPDNQFNTNSVFRDTQGQLFFGTYNGLVSFIPHNIQKNAMPPDVALSNLKLFNKSVQVNDENNLLKEDLNYSNSLTFDHDQNNFTIEFSALNFIKANKNKYAYRLEGFEKNWNYVDIPSATYTNLPAGDYQFLVKSANNDGNWNKNIKKINIEVLPPLWKTWWAYVFYFIVAFTIVYYIMKFLKARSELKQELHFEKMKLDFFTNVSHEIRTPLTLILGPIEKLEKLTAENTPAKKYAISIKNNTERLYRLVNELLDFRKADSGNMRLYFFEEDLVKTLKEIFDSFQTLAEAKNIQYTFKSSNPEILVYFDKDQMEKVFFNLLSNAFKFTPNGGIINLKITLKKHNVKITVSDNGKGISINNLDDIFTNFYQADQSMGTGIGLALTKSLIELHKGKISVKSKPALEDRAGKTTFSVLLQLGKNHLSENDISPMPKIGNNIVQEIEDSAFESFIENPTEENKNKSATILIVEDNDEVRDFIKQSLETHYHVYESENGLEGWKTAIQIIPDLIISDVMMPVMDGLELCRKIKTDVRTSHIPVIMLTAKSAPIHQIEGLKHGADAYVTKPFSDQMLQLNIQNLLSLKSALQKKYSEQILKLPIITNTESSQDEIFLQKLQQIIEDNIGNTNLDLGFITTEIGISKSVLYKKFSALTNLSLNEFIKNQRLKHAVELFQKGETSTLTVALQVGFNDAKYFSREFKKVYGITPSEYIKNKGQTLI